MEPSEDHVLSKALDSMQYYNMAKIVDEIEDDLQLCQVAESIAATIDISDMLDIRGPCLENATAPKYQETNPGSVL